MYTVFKTLVAFFIMGMLSSADAGTDPTGGKPFFPWAWEDQLKPTIDKSVDKTGLVILASGFVSTFAIHQYDKKIYSYNNKNKSILLSEQDTETLSNLGGGLLAAGIAVGQIVFDQENGIKHFKALFLSSASHVTISMIFRRDRPDGSETLTGAFPSGHAAAAFAGAGSLAYSYGWKAGVPAYMAASAIALSRLSGERHWASDLVAGAFIGSFWARASFAEGDKTQTSMWVPSPIYDGMMVTWANEF